MSYVPFKANKFDDFVSFSILSLKPSPNGKFLAAATDTSRQIIFESGTSNIVRDLYGERKYHVITPLTFIFSKVHVHLRLFVRS